MIRSYDKKIKELLSLQSSDTNWKQVLVYHKEMIIMLRHERLIHLLVTIFVGTTMSIAFLVTILSEKLYTILLGIPLMLLFVGYLFHYRFLENTTQNWFKLLAEIRDNLVRKDNSIK